MLSDEHYRRSSDCSFFVFAQPPAKKGKGSRSKKARTSKASSRLSTQSVATTASEAPEMDVDESMDQSMMSQATVKPKATKKGAKGKGKSSKSKKEEVEVEAESQIDADEIDLVQPEPEPAKPKRGGKGKKRVSEEMDNDEPKSVQEELHQPPPSAEPPAKRRATETRSSSVSQAYDYDHVMADAGSVDEAPKEEGTTKKGRKKKGTTSKSRKASDVSVASKATSKTHVPRDSELDAALEAGLDADVHEPGDAEQEPEPEKPRASKKSKGGKKAKAKSPDPPQEPEDPADDQEEQPEAPAEPRVPESEEPDIPEEPEEAEDPMPKSKTAKTSKKKGPKKIKGEEKTKAPATRESSEFKSAAEDRHERDESFVSVEIINKEPEPRREPEAEPAEKAATKKSSKKDVKAKKSKKAKKTEETPPPEPVKEQRDLRSPSRDDDIFGTPNDIPDQVEMVAAPQAPSPEPPVAHERTPVPAKTTKRFSDIPQEEHLAQSFSESQGSGKKERSKPQRTSQPSNRGVSPLPAVRLSTPSMSPQSSDAENRPPSSRPSTARPAVPSASKELKARTPLVASTPSPSKRNANVGFPPSAHPWTPVDIDEVLFGEASDKENADLTGVFKNVKGILASPEKKMTVEEWIMWNAKNGEERLKRECERLVSQFEKEGGRAMQRLEAIECMD